MISQMWLWIHNYTISNMNGMQKTAVSKLLQKTYNMPVPMKGLRKHLNHPLPPLRNVCCRKNQCSFVVTTIICSCLDEPVAVSRPIRSPSGQCCFLNIKLFTKWNISLCEKGYKLERWQCAKSDSPDVHMISMEECQESDSASKMKSSKEVSCLIPKMSWRTECLLKHNEWGHDQLCYAHVNVCRNNFVRCNFRAS